MGERYGAFLRLILVSERSANDDGQSRSMRVNHHDRSLLFRLASHHPPHHQRTQAPSPASSLLVSGIATSPLHQTPRQIPRQRQQYSPHHPQINNPFKSHSSSPCPPPSLYDHQRRVKRRSYRRCRLGGRRWTLLRMKDQEEKGRGIGGRG